MPCGSTSSSHFDQDEGYLAHLHDPLAAAVALDPELVTVRPATVDVELTGTLTRGMTIADWSQRWGREPNALIGVDVDPAAFFDRFISRVGQFARSLGVTPGQKGGSSVPVVVRVGSPVGWQLFGFEGVVDPAAVRGWCSVGLSG